MKFDPYEPEKMITLTIRKVASGESMEMAFPGPDAPQEFPGKFPRNPLETQAGN